MASKKSIKSSIQLQLSLSHIWPTLEFSIRWNNQKCNPWLSCKSTQELQVQQQWQDVQVKDQSKIMSRMWYYVVYWVKRDKVWESFSVLECCKYCTRGRSLCNWFWFVWLIMSFIDHYCCVFYFILLNRSHWDPMIGHVFSFELYFHR